MSHKSARVKDVRPFQVMRLLARAKELESQGRDIVHMEVGEPDFSTPQPVIDAAQSVIATGMMHYTPATGLPALRQRIAQFYHDRYQISVDPACIVITPGASGALLLALAAVIDPGKKILMADPGYPCNRNFTRFLDGQVASVPVDATDDYQMTAEKLAAHWDDDVVGVLLASPANPTGTLIPEAELQSIIRFVEKKAGMIFMDEIYHGLIYTASVPTILKYTRNCFVINSFSKYFGMTGWRVGWLVAPQDYVEAVDNFAQNIFLAAPTPSQHAALAAFDENTITILEQRRLEFKQRRDFLLPALRDIGFDIKTEPQGAFYIYADCSRFSHDSLTFVEKMLEEIGVAITPGNDFGSYRENVHVRFAYTTSMERLQEGVKRLRSYLG